MNMNFIGKDSVPANVVYVREVAVSDLPEEVKAEAMGLETLFAVCRPDGERIALVRDRTMAFVLARQNDLDPVTVH